MNKKEFLQVVVDKTGGTIAEADKYLSAVLDTITEELPNNKIIFTGFGTFYTKERKEREGRNPRTGEKLVIKAATLPAFKPGKKLKQAM